MSAVDDPTIKAPEPRSQQHEASGVLDAIRQEAAKEYAGIKRRLFFVELSVSALLLLCLLLLGWSAGLRTWAASLTTDPWLIVGIYVIVLGAAYTVISVPLGYYSDFILPHRYGLSTQSQGGWLLDNIKELALSAVLGLGGVELLYWLLRSFPDWWWVIMAALAWLFMVALAQLAPILLMPLFYKFTPLTDADLVARLTHIAERAGTHVRSVYVMDMSSRTTAANAMLTGLGSTRRIILGDTLLHGYTPDEIETILAHELAHHVHNDVPKSLVAEAMILLGSMGAAALLLAWGVPRLGFYGLADVAAFPMFVVAMLLVGLVAMPLGNLLSRSMERAADQYALATTGKAAAFRSVMLKLAGQNLSDANPPTWVRILFYSHPSVSERVRTAEVFAASEASQAATGK